MRLATMKLVGYTEVIHALAPRLATDAAIVLFGGLAKERPYPGSTTVTTVNGAVSSMVRTLALELAPVRVNAIHPGVVGDSPAWSGKPAAVLDALVSRTPCGRLASMEDVAHATLFLLDNQSVNGVNLDVGRRLAVDLARAGSCLISLNTVNERFTEHARRRACERASGRSGRVRRVDGSGRSARCRTPTSWSRTGRSSRSARSSTPATPR